MKSAGSLASLSTLSDRPPSRTSLSTMSSVTTAAGGDQSPRVITRGVSADSASSPRADRMNLLGKPTATYNRSVSVLYPPSCLMVI